MEKINEEVVQEKSTIWTIPIFVTILYCIFNHKLENCVNPFYVYGFEDESLCVWWWNWIVWKRVSSVDAKQCLCLGWNRLCYRLYITVYYEKSIKIGGPYQHSCHAIQTSEEGCIIKCMT